MGLHWASVSLELASVFRQQRSFPCHPPIGVAYPLIAIGCPAPSANFQVPQFTAGVMRPTSFWYKIGSALRRGLAWCLAQPFASLPPLRRLTPRSRWRLAVGKALASRIIARNVALALRSDKLTTPYMQQKIANSVLEARKDSTGTISDWDLLKILGTRASNTLERSSSGYECPISGLTCTSAPISTPTPLCLSFQHFLAALQVRCAALHAYFAGIQMCFPEDHTHFAALNGRFAALHSAFLQDPEVSRQFCFRRGEVLRGLAWNRIFGLLLSVSARLAGLHPMSWCGGVSCFAASYVGFRGPVLTCVDVC